VSIVGAETEFIQGTSKATFSGTGITVNSTTVTDATHATANITIASDAPIGTRDVNVVNGAETPKPLRGGFTVNAVNICGQGSAAGISVFLGLIGFMSLAGFGLRWKVRVKI
jgi:hypothetical protein